MDTKQPDPQAPPGYPNSSWDPNHQPANPQLGTYAPGQPMQAGYAPVMQQPVMQVPLMVAVPQPGAVATPTYCPLTVDHLHVKKKERGGLGLMVGVGGLALFLPCFLVAIPMDTKVTCSQCYYVMKQGWGSL